MSNSNIPQINILTDTWQTVITRVNSLVDSLSTEVITANSSGANTGSPLSPRNATLFGRFSANTLSTTSSRFTANDTIISLGSQIKILANNSTGLLGTVLTSGGATGNVYWSTPGSVTAVANGAGLNGGTITTSGTLSVKAGDGITVDSRGVSVGQYLTLISITANSSPGTPGQILVSGGPSGSMYWANQVANGVGLTSNSSGALSVKAGNNIIVNSNGVSVSANVVTINQFSQVKSPSGYTVLPNGVIVQWGTVPSGAGEGSTSVTFPVAFPTACVSLTASIINPSSDNENDFWYQVISLNTTFATLYRNSSDGDSRSVSGYYMAIGY